jgi:hypothetical protein
MAAKKKNSLVANINRKKRAGTSRPKSRSTISDEAYRDMRAGWPRTAKKRKKKKKKKSKARRPSRAGKT